MGRGLPAHGHPADLGERVHIGHGTAGAGGLLIAQAASTLDQSVGSGKELAVVVGTSTMGGRGSVLGTLPGALLVQPVSSGVTRYCPILLGCSSGMGRRLVPVRPGRRPAAGWPGAVE
ncbi:hypothetical protein Asi03nite_01610 [Actinoplanes siamensis]|uniref:Uncharacterized protein n=1 Tax=Actinoplanes siamensis TaxID=1223317 RepID=A0A919N2Y9_9ACTN|nr:hypothetical protein Asi03nite_01610 [Actinoplanes siamensis]